MILFGSYARGTSVDLSDIDLAVQLNSELFDYIRESEMIEASVSQITQQQKLLHLYFHVTPIGLNWLNNPENRDVPKNVLFAIKREGRQI